MKNCTSVKKCSHYVTMWITTQQLIQTWRVSQTPSPVTAQKVVDPPSVTSHPRAPATSCAPSKGLVCGRWSVLTGSRWRCRARSGRWSVLSRSSLRPHLHRSCMRANTRPQTALDRLRQDEANTTNTSTTDPHAFCSTLVRLEAISGKKRGGKAGWAFVCGSIYSGRRLLMWSFRLRHEEMKPGRRFFQTQNVTSEHFTHSRAAARHGPRRKAIYLAGKHFSAPPASVCRISPWK